MRASLLSFLFPVTELPGSTSAWKARLRKLLCASQFSHTAEPQLLSLAVGYVTGTSVCFIPCLLNIVSSFSLQS